MFIPNKFNGYSRDGRRVYPVDGGVAEGAILASMMEAGAAEAGSAGAAGLLGAAEMGGAGAAGLDFGAGFAPLLEGTAGADITGATMAPEMIGQAGEALAPALENPELTQQVMDAAAPSGYNTPFNTAQWQAGDMASQSTNPLSGLKSILDGYKKLDTFDKLALTMGGSMAAQKLFGQNRVGMPTPYRGGNLQKFRYDPNQFTPSLPFNQGGIAALAKGGTVSPNQQIFEYTEAVKTPEDYKALLAKAQAGDYNAMIAMNKLRGTPNQNYAHGGEIGHLGGYSDGGRLLKGPGDGMSDDIPAHIAGKQPARLADGEFVIPADVVSHLGNGSTDAGAKQLYAMMDRIRKARTGNPKQGREINAQKFLPKG